MQQLGKFNEKHHATYTINTLNLPVPWEFIYQNREVLLKVDQFGPVYAQANPPSGIMLIKRDSFQKTSSWLTWIDIPGVFDEPVTNFFRPHLLYKHPSFEPDNISVEYTPETAYYSYEYNGIEVKTELMVPSEGIEVHCQVTITNNTDKTHEVSITPALNPYVNPAQLAPWDRPEWYLKTAFVNESYPVFVTRLLNMNSEKEKRQTTAFFVDEKDLTGFDISYEKYVGQGDFEKPDSIYYHNMNKVMDEAGRWGEYGDSHTIYGYPPVYTVNTIKSLEPQGHYTMKQVLSIVPEDETYELPDYEVAVKATTLFDKKAYENEKDKLTEFFASWMTKRRVESNDKELDLFVNEWLPLQMYWVASLDRGWPSGMRGSRDSANDFTSMIPFDKEWTKEIIVTLFSCQRKDGWFPRQYSALGRLGKHDLRGHVDAGCWVIELLYEYLCHTKDYSLLSNTVKWLDCEEETSVLRHTIQALDYYFDNMGEHGLCLIREGDWLDSVNNAGHQGRGETVTVSNQLVIALRYFEELASHRAFRDIHESELITNRVLEFIKKREQLTTNINKYAYNEDGFYNSVFTDGGEWIFSNQDPDGRKRVYGPASWYSIASGVADEEKQKSALSQLTFLKKEMGYALYHPPMGDIPVEHVGRSGSGDMPFGLWENGNVYNQGSHGFLGRALAVAGEGDLLHEVVRYMLPFDLDKHPSEKALTPPYAVVNCWQQVPGFVHRGGLSFLTGSTAMALRMVYDWIYGIKPQLDGLLIDPCLASIHKESKINFTYMNKEIELFILNRDGNNTGIKSVTLNGENVVMRKTDLLTGRNGALILDNLLNKTTNHIEIVI